MGTFAKVLLWIFLILLVTVILVTWGSIGSAVLTLALLLALGFLALRRFLESHDPDDFRWDD